MNILAVNWADALNVVIFSISMVFNDAAFQWRLVPVYKTFD